MKSSLPFLLLMLCANAALAEPSASSAKTQSAASELVNKQLLTPLKKAESRRSRFSRAAPVAVQRRLRVLDAVSLTDVHGKEFVRFAVDERRAWDERAPWQRDRVVGCAYLNEREVFVRQGKAYLPAKSLLGEDAKERIGACGAVPALAVQVARVDR